MHAKGGINLLLSLYVKVVSCVTDTERLGGFWTHFGCGRSASERAVAVKNFWQGCRGLVCARQLRAAAYISWLPHLTGTGCGSSVAVFVRRC